MLKPFLQDLFNGQQVRVSEPHVVSRDAKEEAASVLSEFEREYRGTLPGLPPAFGAEAAVWAAVSIYTAASVLIHRNLDRESFDRLLDTSQPDRRGAEAHYAVDLTMRFLPDLMKLAKSAASDDPLVNQLKQWAVAWPLSSVGIEGVEPVDATPLRTSSTLMRLYADRIITSEDRSRLDDPVVAETVRAALGDFPELCPNLTQELDNLRATEAE